MQVMESGAKMPGSVDKGRNEIEFEDMRDARVVFGKETSIGFLPEYILEYRSLRSRILALRYRCGVGRRTARMSDAAVLLTKKILKWSDQIFYIYIGKISDFTDTSCTTKQPAALAEG